jgi:hypothetical protein
MITVTFGHFNTDISSTDADQHMTDGLIAAHGHMTTSSLNTAPGYITIVLIMRMDIWVVLILLILMKI